MALLIWLVTEKIFISLLNNKNDIINGHGAVILLLAHHASFAHNFVSGVQSFYFSESQDAIVLQTCH